LCAASNAVIVAGDISEPPPAPDLADVPSEASVLPERSKGLFDSCPLPADCDFDAVSDFSRSSADVAALKACSMTKLQQLPRGAAWYFHAVDQQTPCHRETPVKPGLLDDRGTNIPGN
ncbi:MAG: hypothetical protein Q7U92_24440, partial [Bradyrhizobium sp.]|nr:hypothetical protein [Bradyrhizobium sp.]